ncbi:hypothetical protein CVD28_24965 [Bacillus sp. M6-12]|uniref:hypothetical protein n=1 Tax=Bacillus sp. M6-12 TaxID=2054166 RepID=UPI000C76C1A1|nr:hypothetical protein [Bacillus sp. M6-12]PLS15088.1 hypothetical protein CVD28_24965 [Bacillus sp. M6-12]
MDSMIEKGVGFVLHSLSVLISKGAENMLSGVEQVIANNELFSFSYILFLAFIVCFLWLGIKRVLYFRKGNEYQVKGYWKENKKYFIQMAIMFTICLFPVQILQFTFDYWSSFLHEREIFQQIQHSSAEIEGNTIVIAMISMLSSLSVLWIAGLQVLEVVALILILFLSPIILIGSLFNRKIFSSFIQILTEGVFSPILQTFLMYVSFQLFIPAFLEEGKLTPLMQSLIIFGMVLFTFQGTKILKNIMFDTKHETMKIISISR